MVKVNVPLLRRRAEHNDGILSDLQEISLHQQDITDLGKIATWCPRLKILLLQGNLISDLGKIGRLRELHYLNVALNNLEDLTKGTLAECESLVKLDITANFLANITQSVDVLQNLTSLKELYLNGNPCCDFPGYRSYVITRLPWLKELDGDPVKYSERIKAWKEFSAIEKSILKAQEKSLAIRAEKKRRKENINEGKHQTFEHEESDEQFAERWQTEESEHSPETRTAMHEEMKKRREKDNKKEENNKVREVKLFTKEGRPLNVNEAKVDFKFTDEEETNSFVLEVFTYKYLHPSLLSCDVEPSLVRVTIHGKVLQLVLPREVRCDSSTAKKSQVTGHLLIKMPKVCQTSVFGSSIFNKNISKSEEREFGAQTSITRGAKLSADEGNMADSALDVPALE